MLVLSRVRGESIMIGNDTEVTVVEIRRDKVCLGIDAPKEVPVQRREKLRQRAVSPRRSRQIRLFRKKNESIVINDTITIVVVEIRSPKVRLGIDSPREVPVHRKEVYQAIRRHEAEGKKLLTALGQKLPQLSPPADAWRNVSPLSTPCPACGKPNVV